MNTTVSPDFIHYFAAIDELMVLSRPSQHSFALQELLNDPKYEQIILRKFNYPNKDAVLNDLKDWKEFSDHCKKFFEGLPILFNCFKRVVPCISHATRTIFVYSGKCICEYDNTYKVANQGDVLILPPNVKAGYTCYEANNLSICAMTDPKYFRRELIPKLPMNSACGFSFFDIYTGKSSITEPILLRCGSQSGIFDFLNAAMQEEFSRPLYYHETLDSYLVLFFTALLRIYTKTYYSDQFSREQNGKQMFDIKKYIYDHCETVTLAELAEKFHFKASYLSQYIKKMNGHSFTDMVQKARMDKVCFLLQSTALSISDIIHSVGYQNVGYFYRIFTDEYGMTPSEYRKKKYGAQITPFDLDDRPE